MRLNRKQVISQQKCCEILRFWECIGGAFLVLFKYYCMQLILLLLFSILVLLPLSLLVLLPYQMNHPYYLSARQPATLFRPSACVSPVCLFSAPYLPLLFDVSACWYDWTINNSELKNKNTNKNKKINSPSPASSPPCDWLRGRQRWRRGSSRLFAVPSTRSTELNKIIDKN